MLARKAEVVAAERVHERALQAAREEWERAESLRLDALKQGRETIETLRRGRALSTLVGLTLYGDRVEGPRGTIAVTPDLTAIAGPPSMLAVARRDAVAKLGTAKDERRLLDEIASGSDKATYLLIEAGSAVTVVRCPGAEEAAREFAARVSLAALNAEQVERELREAVRDAERQLWQLDAQHEHAALEAFEVYRERRDDTRAVERARRELAAALAGGDEIERLRASLVQLASD